MAYMHKITVINHKLLHILLTDCNIYCNILVYNRVSYSIIISDVTEKVAMTRIRSQKIFDPDLACEARIFALAPHFTQADHALADLALNHPEIVVRSSARELGRQCNISEASVIRFIQKLRYESLEDFRQALQKDLLSSQTSGRIRNTSSDTPIDVLNEVVSLCMKALQSLVAALDINDLKRAVDAIQSSHCINFFSAGGSIRIAEHTVFKLLRMGYMAVAQAEPFSQMAQASLVGKESVAFGISYTGATKSVNDALAVAKESGAKVICLTNFSGTEITEIADICLITASPGGLLAANAAQTRVAQFAVLDTLLTLLPTRCKEDGTINPSSN
jgi:DNA-binding MurR/RpiR family transcriptional regulator